MAAVLAKILHLLLFQFNCDVGFMELFNLFLFIMMGLLGRKVSSLMPVNNFISRIGRKGLKSSSSQLCASGGDGFGTSKPNQPKIVPINEQAKLNELKKLTEEYDKRTANERRVLEDTVDFPCDFLIKVIGINDSQFVPDMINKVCEELAILPENIQVQVKETSGGKYVSISLIHHYQSASEVYAAYRVLGADKRVKYLI